VTSYIDISSVADLESECVFVVTSKSWVQRLRVYCMCTATAGHERGADSDLALLVPDLPCQPFHSQVLSDTGSCVYFVKTIEWFGDCYIRSLCLVVPTLGKSNTITHRSVS